MKCGKVRELFSSHLEGAIDGRQSAEFEEHLAGCGECRAAYERVNATVMMLEEMPDVEPPADFHATVMARVQEARRAAPQRVRWWEIDWQRVFTIRVPARSAAIGIAVMLLAVLMMQFTPLHGPVANFFGVGKQSGQQITNTSPDDVRQWEPWTPKSQTKGGLKLTIRMESPNVYTIMLGTQSARPITFSMKASSESYSGSVQANQEYRVTVPAPRSDVAVARIAWDYQEMGYAARVFLPAKISRTESPRSLSLEAMSVQDMLKKLSQEYGIAIIASGDLDQIIPAGQVENQTAGGALYELLDGFGIKRVALSQSVYAVESAR
jgi:hypothetical protein